jgi:DNA-binding SARP family transcriptional activator
MLLSSSQTARQSQDQPLRIRLFGGVDVQGLRGAGLGSIEGRTHVRGLIALVASSSLGVSRDETAAMLWPRQSASAARNRLYHTMHLARQALSELAWNDEWITLQHGRILLDPRAISDAQQLEAASSNLAALDDATLLRITDLCVGDWAPEVDAGALGVSIRRHLRNSYIELLREGAGRMSDAGDIPARRELLSRILALSETDEWAYRQLMQMDLAANRPHAVLRRFESAGRAMVEQLGLRPSLALTELAQEAVKRTASAQLQGGPTPPFSLSTPCLVGRGALLQSLVTAMLAQPGAWNLSGLSGVGKTALMREVVRHLGPVSPDGLYWINLCAEAPGANAPSLVAKLADALGLELAQSTGQLQAISAWLQARQAVLVLDDFDAAPGWQALLPALTVASSSRVVLISHQALSAPRLHNTPVPLLAVPSPELPVAQARQSAALALFQLRQLHLDVQSPSEADWFALITLVRRLDGLPLALERAAAKTMSMTAGELLQAVESDGWQAESWSQGRVDLASTVQTDLPASHGRHRSISAALDFSVGLQSPAARKLYCALAVFQGEFHAEAARPLAQAVELDASHDVHGLLHELQGAGLISRLGEAKRYAMLNLARDHAMRAAKASGQWPNVLAAHLDSVVVQLEAGSCAYEDAGYTRWMDAVLAVQADAIALIAHAAKTDPMRCLRLLVPLAHSWSLRALPLKHLVEIDQALGLAREAKDATRELTLLTHATLLCLDARDLAGALRYSEQALPLIEASSDGDAAAYALASRAVALHATGKTAESVQLLLERQARMAPSAPGTWTLMTALARVGQVPPEISQGVPQMLSELRPRMSGSRTWCDLLVAFSEGTASTDPEFRISVANELLVSARELHSQSRAEFAMARLAWAQLALERNEAAAATAYEWYLQSRSQARHIPAAIACLWLAEIAWRLDDALTARRWLDDTRQLLLGEPGHTLHQSLATHAVVVSVLAGDLGDAMQQFLAIGEDVLANCQRFPLLEQVAEAGALLARRAGLDHLAQSLAQSLADIAHPNNWVPLVNRFRQLQIGAAAVAQERPGLQAVEVATSNARRDLGALYSFCRSSLRRATPAAS